MKIRKVDTSKSPAPIREQGGTGGAVLEFNTAKQAVEVNPESAPIQLGNVVVDDSVPDASDHFSTGTLWIRATGPTVYINVGTYASPDWNTITQS